MNKGNLGTYSSRMMPCLKRQSQNRISLKKLKNYSHK